MNRPRIIVATPDPAECEVLADWLAADGFELVKCTTLASAADAIQTQSYDLFVADFSFAFRYRLHDVSRRRIRNQKIPTIVISELNVPDQTRLEDQRAMYLARPVERAALTCLVSMALFDGRPGRRSPRKTIKPLSALVNGAPAHILDVSAEGLRLALPRDGRPAPPPVFKVNVPMIGLTLTVKRMWTRIQPGGQSGPMLCGVALDDPAGEKRWRVLADTLPALDGSMSDFTHSG